MTRPRVGDQFTHDQFIQAGWKPSRTQVWSDAPKAEMVVTAVDGGVVTYTYVKADKSWSRVSFEMPQTVFLERFGEGLRPSLTVLDGGGYTELITNLTATYDRLRAVPDQE